MSEPMEMQVDRLEVRDGDVVMIRLPSAIQSPEAYQATTRLREYLLKSGRDCMVIGLRDGMTIETLSADEFARIVANRQARRARLDALVL